MKEIISNRNRMGGVMKKNINNFLKLENKIKKSLKEKMDLSPITGEDGFSLIQGFIVCNIWNEINSDFKLYDSTLPCVGIVGNTSGKVHLFALKALLPEIEF